MPQGETKPASERALDLYMQIVEREMKIKMLLIKMSAEQVKTYETEKESFQKAFNS